VEWAESSRLDSNQHATLTVSTAYKAEPIREVLAGRAGLRNGGGFRLRSTPRNAG
jgi:hypothetical protein